MVVTLNGPHGKLAQSPVEEVSSYVKERAPTLNRWMAVRTVCNNTWARILIRWNATQRVAQVTIIDYTGVSLSLILNRISW